MRHLREAKLGEAKEHGANWHMAHPHLNPRWSVRARLTHQNTWGQCLTNDSACSTAGAGAGSSSISGSPLGHCNLQHEQLKFVSSLVNFDPSFLLSFHPDTLQNSSPIEKTHALGVIRFQQTSFPWAQENEQTGFAQNAASPQTRPLQRSRRLAAALRDHHRGLV